MSDVTDRLYARLPAFYRDADVDGELLGYLSLIADQLGEIDDLLDRIDRVDVDEGGSADDTSELVDPDLADAEWLDWLAQLVGARRRLVDLDAAAKRTTISALASGFVAGTRAAIAAAAQTELTGTRYVLVSANYQGDQWRVEVRTRTSETPDPNAVLVAIDRARVKPAGVEIVLTSYEATWATLEAQRPTWNQWDGSSWIVIEETGAP